MGGKIVHEGHVCSPPPATGHEKGAVWRCDCGQHWQRGGQPSRPAWYAMSFLDVLTDGLMTHLRRGRDERSL